MLCNESRPGLCVNVAVDGVIFRRTKSAEPKILFYENV